MKPNHILLGRPTTVDVLSWCSDLVIEYRTRKWRGAGRSTASNLEQVTNIGYCVLIHCSCQLSLLSSAGYGTSSSYLLCVGYRTSVADWGGGMSASSTAGPVVR